MYSSPMSALAPDPSPHPPPLDPLLVERAFDEPLLFTIIAPGTNVIP
jgi:hypothetical protein